MKFKRIQIEVDAVKMPISGNVGGNEFNAGDYLVTYADGSVTVLTPDVFELNFEQTEGLIGTKELDISMVPDPPRDEDYTPPSSSVPSAKEGMFTCIGCSQDVAEKNFDKRSGVCHDCLMVRCPTCKSAVKRSDMRGQYCPTCLRTAG